MLYPFSLTLDLYIQAESFEEAKKLAEAYVQDASLDTTDYPEIVQIEEMDWYDLREHANTMSDFIQKLYNYI